VTEHLSNTAEKWESAWNVTEHVSNTEETWVNSMDCDRISVKYSRKWESAWNVT